MMATAWPDPQEPSPASCQASRKASPHLHRQVPSRYPACPGGPPVSPPPRDNAPRAAPSPKPVLPEASPAKENAAPSAAYLLLKPYLFRPLGILPFWRSTSNHPVPVKLSEPWTGKTPPYPKGPQCPPHQAASAPQDKPLPPQGYRAKKFCAMHQDFVVPNSGSRAPARAA